MRQKPTLGEIGSNCSAILDALQQDRARFGLRAFRADCGAEILLAESDAPESAQAGALAAALCQGGLAEASEYEDAFGGQMLPFIRAKTDFPRLATLTLQSAVEFHSVMLSGPVKLHLEQTDEIEYDADPANGSLSAVVQADNIPEDAWMVSLADAVCCSPEQLTLLVAPQKRLLGAAQISGRMNENMIFTMERSLGLDSNAVASIEGYAPVCLPGKKTKEGKPLLPDDFLHYGAFSRLTLAQSAGIDPQALANDLAFTSTDIFGALFFDLLKKADGDFFKIPNLLHINKLAIVEVFDPDSGKTFRAGSLQPNILA